MLILHLDNNSVKHVVYIANIVSIGTLSIRSTGIDNLFILTYILLLAGRGRYKLNINGFRFSPKARNLCFGENRAAVSESERIVYRIINSMEKNC